MREEEEIGTWEEEMASGRDIDGDGYVGDPTYGVVPGGGGAPVSDMGFDNVDVSYDENGNLTGTYTGTIDGTDFQVSVNEDGVGTITIGTGDARAVSVEYDSGSGRLDVWLIQAF